MALSYCTVVPRFVAFLGQLQAGAMAAKLRSKQTCTLENLKALGKATLKHPNPEFYLSEDVEVVIEAHLPFLKALAEMTNRLNPGAMARVGRELFQLGKVEANHWGQALSLAFRHCISANRKSITGEKLSPAVKEVAPESSNFKQEPRSPVKKETPGGRGVKRCLSSPSQIAALYSGRATVKTEPETEPAKMKAEPVKVAHVVMR